MQANKGGFIRPTAVQSVQIEKKPQKTANIVLVRSRKAGARENVDIERLVMWACSEQLAGAGAFDEADMLETGSMWGVIERLAVLGTSVDSSQGGSYRCHRDAERVVAAMLKYLDREEQLLVFGYCSAGLRPDWEPDGVGSFKPVRGGGGKLKMIWGNRSQRRDAVGCQVQQVGATWHHVQFARANWLTWHGALVRLVNVLWGSMETRCPTGPECAKRPWIENNS